jgi:DNA-nicking Smr family endonuclease
VRRRLSADERALWDRVVASVRPFDRAGTRDPAPELPSGSDPAPSKPAAAVPPRSPRLPVPAPPRVPGETLDASWDRRLARGLADPDRVLDLHGHNLVTAYDRLDRALEDAISSGDRLLLLITGKPPAVRGHSAPRGAIRAAVGDWLNASRHAASIAAVRGAHRRHGGAGALYIILRRRR